jgi:hypothetical protein
MRDENVLEEELSTRGFSLQGLVKRSAGGSDELV